MKEKYSSFISEHTAEYVLIPKLTNILKQKYKMVVPVFPWISREGNNLSQLIHNQDKFKIVGFYPRRPKISLTDNKILIKINGEFLAGAEEASKINVPILAGCPIVKSFWDLNNDDLKFIWIKLNNNTKYYYEIECNNGNLSELKILDNTEMLENDEAILNFVDKGSVLHDIKSFLKVIRSVREHGDGHFYMNMGSYKPIYFLFK